MAHIKPINRADLESFEPVFQAVEAGMGFVPNSMFTMARWPELLSSFAGLGGTILNSGEVASGLKQLIAFVVSNAAGCRYCQAHTSHSAVRQGVDAKKISAAFEFETSDLFDQSEKAALRVALHAGMTPNATESKHFDELKQHFTDRQIIEIVAVISFFGFLNRWNDTMATELESSPATFAENTLKTNGWTLGKHSS